MAEYIDVESLVVAYSGHTPDDEFSKGVDFVLDLLDSKPPEDVRPVVRGKWVSDEDTYPGPGMRNYKCSACGKIAGTWRKGLKKEQLYPFCPMCGAYMRGGDNDE